MNQGFSKTTYRWINEKNVTGALCKIFIMNIHYEFFIMNIIKHIEVGGG